MTVVLKIARVTPMYPEQESPLPKYQSAHASGMDLYAVTDFDGVVLAAGGGRYLCSTGIRVEIPIGYEGQIRPRSGLAHQQGVTVCNSPGTIDADYRGEVKVLLVNTDSRHDYHLMHGDRIAQFVIAPVAHAEIVYVTEEELSSTARGEGGFGSTGK
jgi:dUTP pyrophosphatase